MQGQHRDETPQYVYLVDSLVKSFAKEIEGELGLYCEGEGGSMPYDVAEVDISFSCPKRATLEEARQLHVYISERLLDKINADEQLRPFLHEYPFTLARVDVSLSFRNEANCGYSDGTVSFMSTGKGKVFYCREHPFEKLFDHFFEEPYEEAVKRVKRPLALEVLRGHQAKPYEQPLDAFFHKFIKEACKKYDLYTTNFGGTMADEIEEVAICFITDKRTPLEKARKLYVQVTEFLNKKINEDLAIRPYLKEYPFPLSQSRVQITFQQRNGCYYEDGSVAIVTPEEEKISYATMKPMVGCRQSIRPTVFKEESYAEAKKLLEKP